MYRRLLSSPRFVSDQLNQNVVLVEICLLRVDHYFYEDYIMDNQKPTEGKGISATNAGSNMGKSQDSSLNKNTISSGSQQSASSSGNLGASSQGTGALGTSSVGSSQSATAGNSGLGNTGSSASTGSGNASGSSSSDTSSSTSVSSTDKDTTTVGGIKAAISSISPDKVHAGIDKAAQAAQPVVDNLASKAHAGVDKVTGLLGSAQEKFGDRSTQLSEKCSDLSAQGKEYVKNNPASALLAAVGVGFILAKLLGGSSDRSEYRNYRDYRD